MRNVVRRHELRLRSPGHGDRRPACWPIRGASDSLALVYQWSPIGRELRKLAMPRFIVNQEPRTLPSPATVADLLAHLKLDPQRVAVELNREVEPRARHDEQPLS